MKREYGTGKNVTVRAMVTPQIKEKVKELASSLGMTESEYLRHIILKEIESRQV